MLACVVSIEEWPSHQKETFELTQLFKHSVTHTKIIASQKERQSTTQIHYNITQLSLSERRIE